MTATADQEQQKQGSGRPQIVVTKDTTLRIGLTGLIATMIWVAGSSWWFSELRNSDRDSIKAMLSAERDRVNTAITSTNTNVAQISASMIQKSSELSSNLDYATRTFEGYRGRFDRVDDNLHEIKILRHRIDQLEQNAAPAERRVHALETKVEEVYRLLAELRVTTDYLMRWLNPPGVETPRKRNDGAPFYRGLDDTDRDTRFVEVGIP